MIANTLIIVKPLLQLAKCIQMDSTMLIVHPKLGHMCVTP